MRKTFILWLLIAFNCLASELKHDIMNKIKTVAQKPDITESFFGSNHFLDFNFINDVTANGITNALKDWLILHGRSNDISYVITGLPTPEEEGSSSLKSRINVMKQNAEIADLYLRSIKPSIILPILFQILEEGSFGTNEYVRHYVNWYEDDSELKAGSYEGQDVKEELVNVYIVVNIYIDDILKLDTSTNWKIMSIWSRFYGHCYSRQPSTDFPLYWWYDGRRYATNIWNDFYRCWQYEQARPTPRATVLKQLAEEISGLGISALPIIKDAIQRGDTTLSPVLKALAERLEIGGITNINYLSWYSQNGNKYTLPECQGLAAAKARIVDTNFVNEIDGYFNTNIVGHTALRMYDEYPGFMQMYLNQILSFYTNHPVVPNYWYYKLPDDVLEVDEDYVFNLDRNCTNYNPKYLIPNTQ